MHRIETEHEMIERLSDENVKAALSMGLTMTECEAAYGIVADMLAPVACGIRGSLCRKGCDEARAREIVGVALYLTLKSHEEASAKAAGK